MARSLIERHAYAFAVLCIVTSTALFAPGRSYFAKGQWALLYLLIIGFVAAISGVRPALVAAILAFLAWNYVFLPPYHTFVVQDPKDWLSLFVFLILDLSRLEGSAWEPTKDLYGFGEILGTAASTISHKRRARISYDLPDDLPMINVDFPQWARALQNLLENALSYSPETSPVRVGASATDSEVGMWVEDVVPHGARMVISLPKENQ